MKLKIGKLLIIFICLSVILWFIGINEPFVGVYGANLNFFTLAAKNFFRFGYLKLNFVPTYYSGGDLSQLPQLYLHHPVLYFIFVSFPFIFLGFHNWVASVTPIIFSLLTLFWIYKIALFLWNKKVALWSVFFGAVFPLMTVFGRQTIFEPAILSLLLAVYYFFLLFLKDKKRKNLFLIILFTLLAVLVDWGGAYFIFPFIILYKLYPQSNQKKIAIFAYCLTVFIGLSIFLLQVYLLRGNFTDLINAILSRQNNLELFSLSYPLLRNFVTAIVRILVYFTPFSVFGLPVLLKERSVQRTSLLFFLIFGIVNLVALPAASFGHIYFLLYLLPFFALTLGKFGERLYHNNKKAGILLIFSLFFFSAFLTFMKWQQIVKQTWRYEVAFNINMQLIPYETIGVRGFPGDVFEQYFFHPTIPVESYDAVLELLNAKDPGEQKVVFSCWDSCSDEDYEFINSLPYKITKFDKAWLVENSESDKLPTKGDLTQESTGTVSEPKMVIKIYRLLRDILGVGQL